MKKKWITQLRNKEDIKIAILCVIAASVFWFFHAMNENYSTTIDYPLEILYDKTKIIQTQKVPKQLSVHVSGYGWHLLSKQLTLRKKPCIVQITDPNKQLYLTSSQLRTLISNQINHDDIQINEVAGDTFYLPFDWLMTKKVHIEVYKREEDSLKVLKNLQISSRDIEISGPQKKIKLFKDTLFVKLPSLENTKVLKQESISLDSYFPTHIQSKTTTILIDLEVSEYQEKKFFIPLYISNATKKDVLYHKKIEIRCQVKADTFVKLTSEDFQAIINYKQNPMDSLYSVQLVKKPTFVEITKIIPATIKLAK